MAIVASQSNPNKVSIIPSDQLNNPISNALEEVDENCINEANKMPNRGCSTASTVTASSVSSAVSPTASMSSTSLQGKKKLVHNIGTEIEAEKDMLLLFQECG